MSKVPAWSINAIILQLAIVYFLAGLSKINSYWLLEALPLKIWLPTKSGIPIVGPLLEKEALAYLFSWCGAIYDLTIVFFFLSKELKYGPIQQLLYFIY